MKTLHFAIIAVFCCIIFFLSPSDSHASTCAVKETIYSAPQFFLLSDNVFAGTVTSITDYGNHQWQVHFDIEKAWKGAATRQTSTVMTNTLQACGYSILVGEKYLIYTNGSPSFINPVYSKLYSNASGDMALFDDPKFQSQEQAKEDLNKKLESAQGRVESMMMDKSSHIPVVGVGVDQVNSTLDIMIDDEKAIFSIGQYQQDLKEILGDVPIKVEFGHPTTLMPILHSVNDEEQTRSHPITYGSNSSNVLQSPLKQFKSGIVTNDVKCTDDLYLVIKTEDDSPACVKPDTAQKLMERGWAKEIVSDTSITKISQTKNQVISIGNDTYDTIEFKTMTDNTVSLDNVKFTYRGASPLNNNCYPDLTNQTEARDFEMIPGNVSDMNTHQCWPPSNYPLKITNENTIPTDLFSKYSINFFDYNQTIGVGWCHSDSCYLGQTLYLVKRIWDAPVTYDDPVSLLEFHLGTNASVISSGQAIAINMSTSNKLPKTILVPSEYNYSFKGTGLGPCTYRPFDLAILEGFYGENNFTQGNTLSLYQPGVYSCPASIAPQGYKFEPMSNNVVDRCEPFDGCSNTEQMQFRTSFSGSWNNTSFHKFKSGVYTIIAGDEWGHFAIQHFVVINSTKH